MTSIIDDARKNMRKVKNAQLKTKITLFLSPMAFTKCVPTFRAQCIEWETSNVIKKNANLKSQFKKNVH